MKSSSLAFVCLISYKNKKIYHINNIKILIQLIYIIYFFVNKAILLSIIFVFTFIFFLFAKKRINLGIKVIEESGK